jgi:agmatine/peptidylarginine deiminase
MDSAFNFTSIVNKSLEFHGGTGHIDLWSKQFDEESILVLDMPTKYQTLTDYGLIQQNKDQYKSLKTTFGTNYRFLDVPMPKLDNSADMPTNDTIYYNDPRSYLNGVFVNNYYIYPSFSNSVSGDVVHDNASNEALKKLMPGYTLVPIDSRLLSTGGGAIHCITMQIPKDPDKVITITHQPIRDNVELKTSYELTSKLLTNSNNSVTKKSIY